MTAATRQPGASKRPRRKPPKRPARPKRTVWIEFTAFPDEARAIDERARAAGGSRASFLRQLALGYEPRPVVDHDSIQQLLRIAGDLGRLGGLLAMFLKDDRRLERFHGNQVRAAVEQAVQEVRDSQSVLRETASRALRSRGSRDAGA